MTLHELTLFATVKVSVAKPISFVVTARPFVARANHFSVRSALRFHLSCYTITRISSRNNDGTSLLFMIDDFNFRPDLK